MLNYFMRGGGGLKAQFGLSDKNCHQCEQLLVTRLIEPHGLAIEVRPPA